MEEATTASSTDTTGWSYEAEPVAVDVTWGALFAAVSLVTLGGNLLVVYSVLEHRHMRTKVYVCSACIFKLVFHIHSKNELGKSPDEIGDKASPDWLRLPQL